MKRIVPECRYPEEWVRPLEQTGRQFKINTPKRIAAFFSQIAVESAQLNRVDENLYYSARRIVEVWPTRFKDLKAAEPYVRNPQKLANKVYANRLGNGNEYSGDGYRYRGRGLIQVTGRGNYERIGKILQMNLLNYPDALLQPKFAALSAGAFWVSNGLLNIDDVVVLTNKISDVSSALEQRKQFGAKALEVLSEVVVANDPVPAVSQPSLQETAAVPSWF